MPNQTFCEALNKSGCANGIFLTVWHPINEISSTDRILRSTFYFLIMCYLFLGVSIIADKFMSAIEMITSQERKFEIKRPNDVTEIIYVKIWNETVSNLTLMALGSSAPEILLSIIETIGKNFEAGELGPGTIVGSAAFNLFIIIGLCVMVVPKNETRKTKHLLVFVVTTIWSIFAYIWLYLILAVISPQIVEVWEAVLTFMFFPLTVISAYIADKKICFKHFLTSKVLSRVIVERRQTDSSKTTDHDSVALRTDNTVDMDLDFLDDQSDDLTDSYLINSQRMEYLDLIKELRITNEKLNVRDLEKLAEIEFFKRKPKSRAYYRMNAMQKLTGSPGPLKRAQRKFFENTEIQILSSFSGKAQQIYFEPNHYTLMENDQKVTLNVKRVGEFIETTMVDVDYYTEDGTAISGSDYIKKIGAIRFEFGQICQEITVNIIDDDIYEEDEYFHVKLNNPRLVKRIGEQYESLEIKLGLLKSATVMILDDDYGGTFHFDMQKMFINENIGNLEIKVFRSTGARGEVRIPIKIVPKTAVSDQQYHQITTELIFKDNQTEDVIIISIYDENEYEKEAAFFVELGDPIITKNSDNKDGNVKLGDMCKMEIVISENPDLKRIIDHLIDKGRIERVVFTPTWCEQLKESFVIEYDEARQMPSCGQYILHYLSLFWKILFSLVPPPDIWNGWLCFVVSITIIGILTAFIGDVASHFGCHVGLPDSVTAISFVALGTSLPDTFASKVAAINDKTADASIGNVIGSNAVNVFLGIGVAWSIASIYHAVRGSRLNVKSGSLGFSVTLFTILALIAITIMLIRRIKRIGGELGGPTLLKYITGVIFCSLWLFYLIVSSLEIYCHIKGF